MKFDTDEMTEAQARSRLVDTVQSFTKKAGLSPEQLPVTPENVLDEVRKLTPETLRKLDPTRLRQLAQRMRECRIVLARTDVNEFTQLVMRDERTGKPVVMAPHHAEWHRFLDSTPRAVMWAHVEAAKTSAVGVARELWKTGRNPNRRAAIISNTFGQSEKIVRSLGRYIEQSPELRQIFPRLRRSEPWTTHQITVARDTYSRDPTIQSCGVHGNILGSRLDDVVVDDVLDYENTRSAAMRTDLLNWYTATITGRLVEDGTVVACGTAWHPDDIMHTFAKQPGWSSRRWPVLRADGSSNWPSRWSLARIEQRRIELGPLEFARQMMCKARDEGAQRFKREWIETCLRLGDGYPMIYSMEEVGASDPVFEAAWRLGGIRLYTGVDLAVSKKSSADDTVLFTIAVYPNGMRRLLWIDSGKMSGPQIIEALVHCYRRFGSTMIVENVAAQAYIIQFSRELTAMPVLPFQTSSRTKWNPEFGVESMAAEMAGGKWIIPNMGGKMHSEVLRWVDEMLDYDPRQHTGDRLMASWFAREHARAADLPVPEVSMRVIGAPPRRKLIQPYYP